MSKYREKLLELLSVECETENPRVLTTFTGDQAIDIEWAIDPEVAKQLKTLIEPNKNYKYRLSFQSMAIPTKHTHYSWVTKTHGDKSDNVFFSCTDSYVKDLETLKTCTHIAELKGHPSFNVLTQVNEQIEEREIKKNRSSGKMIKRVRIAIAACIVFAIILLYSGHSYYFEPAHAKKPTASAHKDVSPQTPTLTETKLQAKAGKSEKETVSEKPETKQETVPVFHIDKFIASYVPEGSVALTFDDGPSKHTKEIVDILAKNHAGGTFFYIGTNVKKFPDMVKYAHTNGFSIGNHSMTHPVFSKLSLQKQKDEILETNRLIEGLTSVPVTLFRPPYEAKNQTTLNVLQKNHMKMVLWDRDPRDWDTKDPNKIFDYIKENDASGTIILLHESKNVVDILPKVIDYLKSKDLQIVSLSK